MSSSRKHPHGRGEDFFKIKLADWYEETPPRAWGRQNNLLQARKQKRNTPTGVGKTEDTENTPGLVKKHPHGRGEDGGSIWSKMGSQETPPRAWGRRRSPVLHRADRGNTPTGVGKTATPLTVEGHEQKHPHGRGEDIFPGLVIIGPGETPPRAWGRRGMPDSFPCCSRNTPTGVGKTSLRNPKAPCPRKHPHGRGEDPYRMNPSPDGRETPPRAWGRLIHLRANEGKIRNTPTGVGKTGIALLVRKTLKKHPHGRGEDTPIVRNRHFLSETPPRAWGRQPPQNESF